MILCCAHCEEPISAEWDDDMFCSDECADKFEAEMLADATGDEW